jgi:prepilin-type N-terminal cleavage/methylation domain-containing protein
MKVQRITNRLRRGFTLIELLIVVAIIAILAAIAVPNFLEAQTRSKVSRLFADMRTIALAMEMYRTDNNDYPNSNYPLEMPPPTHGHGGYLLLENLNGSFAGYGHQLTSPVEYITSIPYDEFWSVAIQQLYPGIAQASVHVTTQAPGGFGYSNPLIANELYAYWLTSPGPNYLIWAHDCSTVYDPTNGTVSYGDIFYLHQFGFVGGSGNRYAGVDRIGNVAGIDCNPSSP